MSGGGYETVSGGYATSDTAVKSGGYEVLSSGGTASFTTVSSGGFEVLSSGGSAVSTTVEDGGKIDLAFLVFSSGGTATLDRNTDVLTVSEGDTTYTQQMAATTPANIFTPRPDTGSGTLITLNNTPCYCRGTRILTDRGRSRWRICGSATAW